MTSQNHFILAADNSPSLLPLLRSNTALASSQDNHGYSILHAAASYNHNDLLRMLVSEFHVDPNIKDEDGETPLFVVETVEAAQILEELGADLTIKNAEGVTAEQKIRDEGDFTTVADFLREARRQRRPDAHNNGDNVDSPSEGLFNNDVHPPPLPPNVRVDLGAMSEENVPDRTEVDPEFRRRIEELAARDDFQGEEGQRQLRELITDAVRGVDEEGSDRATRRRLE